MGWILEGSELDWTDWILEGLALDRTGWILEGLELDRTGCILRGEVEHRSCLIPTTGFSFSPCFPKFKVPSCCGALDTSKLSSVCVVLHSSDLPPFPTSPPSSSPLLPTSSPLSVLLPPLLSPGLDRDSLSLNLFRADLKDSEVLDSFTLSPELEPDELLVLIRVGLALLSPGSVFSAKSRRE
jgi:hypothetical protein